LHRCRFFHENGRENRNNGNQEKGKEEKEALRSEYEVKRGRQKRPLSFLEGCYSAFAFSPPSGLNFNPHFDDVTLISFASPEKRLRSG
jgi:hypothetical protein